MFRTSLAIALFALIALFSFCVPTHSIGAGVIMVGGEYTVQPGETRNGDVIIFFGQFGIQKGGTVTGNVYLIGSSLDQKGLVKGNTYSFKSDVELISSTQNVVGINAIHSLHKLPLLRSILMVIS